MQIRTNWLSGLGAVALAILGSATWDFIAKPVFLAISEGVLWLGTLGLKSVRNGIYAEIGHAPTGSIQLISLNTTMIFLVIIMILYFGPFIVNSRRLHAAVTSISVPFWVIWVRSRYFGMLAFSFGIFMITATLFLHTRTTYVSAMAARLERYQLIVRPHISEEKAREFKAKVALIQSRDDFLPVYTELRKLAIEHGLRADGDPFIL